MCERTLPSLLVILRDETVTVGCDFSALESVQVLTCDYRQASVFKHK